MTVATTFTTQSAFSALEMLAYDRTPLSLTHHYRGISLAQSVHVFSVCEDYIVFRASETRPYALPEFSQVFLQHPGLPSIIRAQVQNASLELGTYLISDFSFLENEWVERSAERVQPKLPVYVLLTANRKRMIVTLFDIHASGAAVSMKERYAKAAGIVNGSDIQLNFRLLPAYDLKRLKGTIVNLDHFSGSLMRAGIRLKPDLNQTRQLVSYLNTRRSEIMTELDRAFLRGMEPRRVEDLYF